ncbi:MAG: hypothetical protein PHT99_02850 [Methanoregula sp.]|nr:hypothetical protein [Methanoregula sp.]
MSQSIEESRARDFSSRPACTCSIADYPARSGILSTKYLPDYTIVNV